MRLRTTLLDCLPWLTDVLSEYEIRQVDDYVVSSIDDAIYDLSWYEIEDRFRGEVEEYAQQEIKKVAHDIKLVYNQEVDSWFWHNEHGHPGSLEMCEHKVCKQATEISRIIERIV